jgi:hypothetical protein
VNTSDINYLSPVSHTFSELGCVQNSDFFDFWYDPFDRESRKVADSIPDGLIGI